MARAGQRDITRRLRILNLEARLEFEEVLRVTLMRTIKSPLTAADTREEALRLHEDSLEYSARLRNELNPPCRLQSNLVH